MNPMSAANLAGRPQQIGSGEACELIMPIDKPVPSRRISVDPLEQDVERVNPLILLSTRQTRQASAKASIFETPSSAGISA
jgi:hypothetical protein